MDQWICVPDSKNLFSVANAYLLTRPWSMHDHHPMRGKDWKKLWTFKLQDRLKLFLWKCLQSALPLRGFLSQFVVSDDRLAGLCSLCGLEIEMAEHLFLRCQIARVVWREAPWPIQVDLIPSVPLAVFVNQLLYAHHFFGIAKSSLHPFILCAALLMDSLWHLRNEVVHCSATPDPLVLLASLWRHFSEHVLAWDMVSLSSSFGWIPPLLGCLNATWMLP